MNYINWLPKFNFKFLQGLNQNWLVPSTWDINLPIFNQQADISWNISGNNSASLWQNDCFNFNSAYTNIPSLPIQHNVDFSNSTVWGNKYFDFTSNVGFDCFNFNTFFMPNNINFSSSSSSSKAKYRKPISGALNITSPFGPRKQPKAGASTNHKGVDIGVPTGTPVMAIGDGVVTTASDNVSGYGTAVYIKHDNGDISEYGHLSSLNVKVGDRVTAGQVIAKSGNTGVSTGPHLHLTIKKDGKAVDPMKYIS